MVFNLIHEKWIRVKRENGTTEVIAPWQVTDGLELNPIIALDAPRPDFNGALVQFLIGLVQTTMSPKTEREWKNVLINPPNPENLKSAFESVSHAFELDGNGARFMQDYDLDTNEFKDKDKLPIERLFVGMPGKETIDQNRDHFLKRDSIKKICYPCCAMALYTFENYGNFGRGHRVPLRGGNGLTTIILGNTLWQTIWLNILNNNNLYATKFGDSSKTEIYDIFPWMGNFLIDNEITTPQHVNSTHMFWAMPHRIFVDFEKTECGLCDVCGDHIDNLIVNFVRKPYGINYKGAWIHSLTPYRKNTKNNEYMPAIVEQNGINYRHWLGLIQGNSDQTLPAFVVHSFYERKDTFTDLDEVLEYNPRLLAFGYDSKSAKVKCWYDGKMPLIYVESEIRITYENEVARLINTSNLVAKNTMISVKNTIKRRVFEKKEKIPDGKLSHISARFWNDTEPAFYETINQLHGLLYDGKNTINLKRQWLQTLSKVSLSLFDEYSQSTQLGIVDPKRIAISRNKLRFFNSEHYKDLNGTLHLSE